MQASEQISKTLLHFAQRREKYFNMYKNVKYLFFSRAILAKLYVALNFARELPARKDNLRFAFAEIFGTTICNQ